MEKASGLKWGKETESKHKNVKILNYKNKLNCCCHVRCIHKELTKCITAVNAKGWNATKTVQTLQHQESQQHQLLLLLTTMQPIWISHCWPLASCWQLKYSPVVCSSSITCSSYKQQQQQHKRFWLNFLGQFSHKANGGSGSDGQLGVGWGMRRVEGDWALPPFYMWHTQTFSYLLHKCVRAAEGMVKVLKLFAYFPIRFPTMA